MPILYFCVFILYIYDGYNDRNLFLHLLGLHVYDYFCEPYPNKTFLRRPCAVCHSDCWDLWTTQNSSKVPIVWMFSLTRDRKRTPGGRRLLQSSGSGGLQLKGRESLQCLTLSFLPRKPTRALWRNCPFLETCVNGPKKVRQTRWSPQRIADVHRYQK